MFYIFLNSLNVEQVMKEYPQVHVPCHGFINGISGFDSLNRCQDSRSHVEVMEHVTNYLRIAQMPGVSMCLKIEISDKARSHIDEEVVL